MTTEPIVLVIDDMRSFKPEFASTTDLKVVYARNSKEGLQWLYQVWADGGEIAQLFLDHDLGFVENAQIDTIWPVIEELTGQGSTGFAYLPKIDNIVIITSNPSGQRRMIQALEPLYGIRCVAVNPSTFFTINP